MDGQSAPADDRRSQRRVERRYGLPPKLCDTAPKAVSCTDKRTGEDRTERGMQVLEYVTGHPSKEWTRDLRTTKHDFYIYRDAEGNELFSILVYGKFDVYSIEIPGHGSSLWACNGLNNQEFGQPVAAASEVDAAITVSNGENAEQAGRANTSDFS